MKKLNVLLLRTNKVDPDPRVEKEVNSLLNCEDLCIEVLAWDRECNYKYHQDTLSLQNGNTTIHRLGIKAGWGVGIKKNAIAFVKYSIRTLIWLIKNHKKYDVIHACDLQTIIPSFIPILLFRKRFVYDIYDYFSDTAHGNYLILKLSKKIETIVINRADATIICSEKRKEQIFPAKPRKLVVIHNAPSRSQIIISDKSICKTHNDNTKLVYVGNLVEDRCIDLLIEVMKKNPEIELHIGGMGKLEKVVEKAARENENIYYYGKMKYNDVLALEKECDIIIALYDQAVHNHKYAAPNKFYESLALGKPIIMLHDTGMDELVDRYNLGITVDQNINSISSGINVLIKRKGDMDTMGKRAYDLFLAEYCWEIMEERLKEMYKMIAGVK